MMKPGGDPGVAAGRGRLSRLTVGRTAVLVGAISVGLEFAQLLPRPGILDRVPYTFDVLDLLATLAAVGISSVIAKAVLGGRGHGGDRPSEPLSLVPSPSSLGTRSIRGGRGGPRRGTTRAHRRCTHGRVCDPCHLIATSSMGARGRRGLTHRRGTLGVGTAVETELIASFCKPFQKGGPYRPRTTIGAGQPTPVFRGRLRCAAIAGSLRSRRSWVRIPPGVPPKPFIYIDLRPFDGSACKRGRRSLASTCKPSVFRCARALATELSSRRISKETETCVTASPSTRLSGRGSLPVLFAATCRAGAFPNRASARRCPSE